MGKPSGQCSAIFDGQRCLASIQVLTWCRYHWRQQHHGRAFTPHVPRRPRGAAFIRDELGRKMCPRCKQWRPVSEFTPAANTGDGLQSWCSECASDYMTRARYGIGRTEVEDMVQRQGGCAMCGVPRPRNKGFRNGWHVDHDHSCCPGDRTCGSCIRAILCADCNKLIGMAQDSVVRLEQAIAYLRSCEEKHEADE